MPHEGRVGSARAFGIGGAIALLERLCGPARSTDPDYNTRMLFDPENVHVLASWTFTRMPVAVVLAVALLVGAPLLTLLHELGHAVVAALALGGRVTVTQGPAPARVERSLWRLDLQLRWPVKPHQVWVGWARWGRHPSRWRRALALAGGPATSVASSAACFWGSVETLGSLHLLLFALAGIAGGQALSSGLPMRYGRRFGQYGGVASDGLKICTILLGRDGRPATAAEPAHAPATTAATSA